MGHVEEKLCGRERETAAGKQAEYLAVCIPTVMRAGEVCWVR